MARKEQTRKDTGKAGQGAPGRADRERPLARSGAFSSDPAFDPDELFAVVSSEDAGERITAAMRRFVEASDLPSLELAVGRYIRSARARGDEIEAVLATLAAVADRAEGAPRRRGLLREETALRRSILRGVLIAFFGEQAVDRGAVARARRQRAIAETRDEPSGERWRAVREAERAEGKAEG